MYMTNLKSLLTQSIRTTFGPGYPTAQFRNLHASIEYPDDRQHYPGIWVDFEPTGELERAGIGHFEVDGNATGGRAYTRWTFKGYVTFTLVALTSLERDLLLDEMIRVLAFGAESEYTSAFRSYIEDNGLLNLSMDFDQVAIRASGVTPGTPWGTDEFIYESTVAMEILGDFVSDSVGLTLVPLTRIALVEYADQEVDPSPTW